MEDPRFTRVAQDPRFKVSSHRLNILHQRAGLFFIHEIRREFVWNRTEYWMSSSSVLCMSCFIVKKRKMLFISGNFLFCFWVWYCMLMTLKQRKNKNNLRWKFTTTYILGNNHFFLHVCWYLIAGNFGLILICFSFQKISRKERKLKIDGRFEKMFTDKSFTTKCK